MSSLLEEIKKELTFNVKHPDFKAGDTITVHYKIKEGDKERVQNFTGVVIQIKNENATRTFTVRKISHGVGVERIFPYNSPFIEKIDIVKRGKVRRARIYYIRNLSGKSARIKEKLSFGKSSKEAAEVAAQ
ncbi:MAG TPA: 50S ribosomal protein L19 [Bacteroidia bacterium]|jgi:large subunit ribosomal protein L19|nr:50S ribosomal protein L19 [Bacteroidia bacterium]